MKVAFDSYYYDDSAKTVGVSFLNWEDPKPLKIETEIKNDIAAYEPGSFYKRELPCILSLLKKFNLEDIQFIVVDGYCILDDDGKLGLGGYLYESLDRKIPVIGVAKTKFRNNTKNAMELLRGESKKPLYISAIGMPLTLAHQNIKEMDGPYRMPTLLSVLDVYTKKEKHG